MPSSMVIMLKEGPTSSTVEEQVEESIAVSMSIYPLVWILSMKSLP